MRWLSQKHNQKFIVAIISAEGCLGEIIWVHVHLMIPRAQIKLGEEPSTMEFIEQLVNHRDGKFIFDSLLIQSLVVDTKTPGAIMFLDEKDR